MSKKNWWEISFGVKEDVWSAARRMKLEVSLRSDESSVSCASSFFANARITRREMMLVSKVIGKVVRTVQSTEAEDVPQSTKETATHSGFRDPEGR